MLFSPVARKAGREIRSPCTAIRHREYGLVLAIYAQTGGGLPRQGRSCSSCPARRNSVASSPKRAENIMPSGNPALFHATGIGIDGCPDILNMLVPGM